MNLYQKVVLITGASSGIGKAVALVLSTRQNRIVITARREELLILWIPPLLCIELFRSGILPSINELPRAVSIKISGKKIGNFVLFELQYPSNYDSDRIRLKLTKK